MNCWKILDITPTSDIGAIKEAFAKASINVHPEEHPEEFRQLHDAYKAAVKSAKMMTVKQNGEAAAEPGSGMAKSRIVSGDTESPCSDDEEEENRGESKASDTADQNWGPDIFAILDEEQSRMLENAGFLTGQFLELITALARSKAKNSDESWRGLFSLPDFQPLLKTHFFIEKLTVYVASQRKLPDAFYLVMSEYYSLDLIANRVDKGPLTGLYNIMLQRKRTHVLIVLKRNYLPLSISTGIFFALVPLAGICQTPAIALAASLIPLGTLIVIAVRENSRKKKRLEDEASRKRREISAFNAEDEDEALPESIPEAGRRNAEEQTEKIYSSPKDRPKKEKKWLPFAHIKDTRCYPAGSIFAVIDLVLVLFLIILYITDNWIFCIGFILSLIFSAVMLLTNIIVLIKGLITKNRTMNRLHPLTFWIPFALFIILTVAFIALPLPQ